MLISVCHLDVEGLHGGFCGARLQKVANIVSSTVDFV